MASKHEIEMDFRRAKEQAQKLEEAANALNTLSKNKFNGTLQLIANSWKGDSASLYLKKGTTLQNEMTGTANELKSIASDIREIARRIYEAEMRNLERARHRHHH